MIADGPLSPYSALLTKLLVCESWNVTFGRRSINAIRKKKSARVICGWTYLSDNTTPQESSISLPFLPVFRIEVWDLEDAYGLWLDFVHEVLFGVLDDVPSEQHGEKWTHAYMNKADQNMAMISKSYITNL